MKKFSLTLLSLIISMLFAFGFICGCDALPSDDDDNNTTTSEHADKDADGLCDDCGRAMEVDLSFYAVNDLHGKFIDTENQPGVDEFTTYMKKLYADTAREEVLLSTGDMWQGTVESSTTKGKLMTDWMNDIGFAAMTLGNHEYDWGGTVIANNFQSAEFPFLAINVTQDGQPVNYCKASCIVERKGLKVGIIGAIGDCLSSISGDFSKGLAFATGDELTKLVKDEATRLREKEGCEFIVYSIHDGSEKTSTTAQSVTNKDMAYYDTSLSDGYVDLVFEGHTHKNYILKDEYGVYHIQGGGENKYVSCADVSFNIGSGENTVYPRLINQNTYASSTLDDDPAVEEIFNKYFPDGNPYTTVVGNNSARRNSTYVCNQLAKLYFEFGKEQWGSQYKIVLGGGYLKLRSPYYLYEGEVTQADIFSILPFDNEIVLGKIKGSDLKSKFINSSNESYHIYKEIGVNEVNDNDYYYIIIDSYTSTYKYNNITEIDRVSVYPRDLLEDFIATGEWGRY